MKKYELVVVFNASKNKEEIDALTAFVDKTIAVSGGTNVVKDVWGEKDLAYLINKQSKGYYILYTFESIGDKNIDMEAKFNMNIDVIRYLIIKDEKEKIFKKLEARAARKSIRLAARAEKERAFRENNEGATDDRRRYERNSGNSRYNKNRLNTPTVFAPPIATAESPDLPQKIATTTPVKAESASVEPSVSDAPVASEKKVKEGKE